MSGIAVFQLNDGRYPIFTVKNGVAHGPAIIAGVVQILPVHPSNQCDRCYDFLNFFAEKFSEKIGVFDSKQS
jgi:hypothetical protein